LNFYYKSAIITRKQNKTGYELMKKFIKTLTIMLIIATASVYFINSETDFFRNFSDYCPHMAEKFPMLSSMFFDISELLSTVPEPGQIKEHLTKEEMPVDPDSFAENAYIKNSPLLTFFENESAGIMINDGRSLTIFGVLNELGRSNLALRFRDESGDTVYENFFSTDTALEFTKTIDIPDHNGILNVELFTGEKKYGNYQSWITDYIKLKKSETGWEIISSPTLENNRRLYEAKRSTAQALAPTESIQSESNAIKSVAEQLTAECDTDYEKIKAIHDWICTYLHYDNDSLSKSRLAPYSATEVLKNRKAVCLGFANLYAALCRSINIPCSVVTGYALGISSGSTEWTEKIVNGTEENHAWNEAYVDGRWIIIDSTWDTFNSYENGEMKKGGHISHLYFDANIDFFSSNHKIMNYQ